MTFDPVHVSVYVILPHGTERIGNGSSQSPALSHLIGEMPGPRPTGAERAQARVHWRERTESPQEIGRLAQVEQGFNAKRRVRTLAADNSIQLFRYPLLEKQIQGHRLQVVERGFRHRQSVYEAGQVIR